jgi:hypothetical protein
MPRFYAESPFGYDLDIEQPFAEVDGCRFQISIAGSFIMVCPSCGQERFREWLSYRDQCSQGHGKMLPLPLRGPEREHHDALWEARNLPSTTTVAQRRLRRLRLEASHLDVPRFGSAVEADFPDGLAAGC